MSPGWFGDDDGWFLDEIPLAGFFPKIRRFLRDPDGVIWSDADLLQYFNDAALEIAQKTGILEKIETYVYPPRFNWSHVYDWELEFITGDAYQALTPLMWVSGRFITYPWEADPLSGSTPDDGYRVTQPWESVYGAPAEPPRLKLKHEFSKMKFIAFDRQRVTPISRRELAGQDRFYKTRTGRPLNYYLEDGESNELILYPRPSSVTWTGG